MADFRLAIAKTLEKEGGEKFTDVQDDKGGATKFGISKTAYPLIDIRTLTRQQACNIYKEDYWDRVRGDDIQSQIAAENIFDTAVNMGVKTTSRLVQTTLNEVLAKSVVVDGQLGAATVEALNKCGATAFLAAFTIAKIARYAAICNKDKTQNKFLLGWINRALGGS